MNILQVIHSFPPEGMAGSEIYAYNLSKALSDRHRVSVFYRIKDADMEEYGLKRDDYDGLKVYKINNTLKDYNSLERIYRNPDVEKKFSEVLDEVNPDIVHIQHLLFLSTGIIDLIKRRNIPIAFTLHDYWLLCPRGQLLRRDLQLCSDPLRSNCLTCIAGGLSPGRISKKLFSFLMQGNFLKRADIGLTGIYDKVDLFISPSEFLRDRFIEFGMPQEKIIHSESGMDLGLFNDVKKTDSERIRFGYIGTLIPSKGPHILIKAFNRISPDKAVLKIYGRAPVNNGFFDYHSRIKWLSKGNKGVRFMGGFDNKDIAGIFCDIDVLVVPSLWWENSPLVIREAFITKTPVMASDVGGIRELVREGVNGFLFGRGDVRALSDVIKRVVEDPGLINGLKQGYGRIENIEDDAGRTESIYSALLKK